jgi:alpha-beta hydrolase superfamily lysophospholipase
MKVTDASFDGERDCPIFYRKWEPEETPIKGLILLMHGYAEHSGRYTLLAEYLTGRGYVIYAPDHRCHGCSGGEKALIDDMDWMLNDLARLLDIAAGDYPTSPAFALGHSMGGLLAACFTILHGDRLAGAVFSAPGIMIGAGVPGVVQSVSKLLARVAPRIGVQELDSAWLSHDPAIAADYDTDPLNYRGKVMARTGVEMLRKANWAMEHMSTISIPILCLHGSADKLADPAGSQFICDHASSSDKTLHILDGMYHEIFNEYGKEKVYEIVGDWLDAH